MATATRRPYKEDWKVILPVFRRLFISPAFITYIVFAFIADYLVRGLGYLWLKSYLFDPYGILAWSTFGVLAVAQGLIVARMIRHEIPLSAIVRQARQRYDNYEPGSEAHFKEVRDFVRRQRNLSATLFIPILFLLCLIPPITFGVWREMQMPLVQSPKHPRPYSPRKELQRTLAALEKRGIFTRPNPDQ